MHVVQKAVNNFVHKLAFSQSKKLVSQEFEQTFKKGQRWHSPFFMAVYFPAERAAVGVSVAKKNVKLSTRRNHCKRMVRESFRLNQHRIGNYHIVIVVKTQAQHATNPELFQCLERLWHKLDRQCATSSSA